MFQRLIEALEVKPEEILFIGDNDVDDISGALRIEHSAVAAEAVGATVGVSLLFVEFVDGRLDFIVRDPRRVGTGVLNRFASSVTALR